MRILGAMALTGVLALGLGVTTVGTSSAQRPVAERAVGGCQVFPADNWWNADISALPVHARSRQWLSHMSTGRALHPDFGPSYGDGPNYGIPVTVVKPSHAKVRVRFDYADESDRVRYPLGRDTRVEGGRGSGGDKHTGGGGRGGRRVERTRNTRHPG